MNANSNNKGKNNQSFGRQTPTTSVPEEVPKVKTFLIVGIVVLVVALFAVLVFFIIGALKVEEERPPVGVPPGEPTPGAPEVQPGDVVADPTDQPVPTAPIGLSPEETPLLVLAPGGDSIAGPGASAIGAPEVQPGDVVADPTDQPVSAPGGEAPLPPGGVIPPPTGVI